MPSERDAIAWLAYGSVASPSDLGMGNQTRRLVGGLCAAASRRRFIVMRDVWAGGCCDRSNRVWRTRKPPCTRTGEQHVHDRTLLLATSGMETRFVEADAYCRLVTSRHAWCAWTTMHAACEACSTRTRASTMSSRNGSCSVPTAQPARRRPSTVESANGFVSNRRYENPRGEDCLSSEATGRSARPSVDYFWRAGSRACSRDIGLRSASPAELGSRKRYPTPRTVSTTSAVSPSLRRMARMCTSIVRSSTIVSSPNAALISSVRRTRGRVGG